MRGASKKADREAFAAVILEQLYAILAASNSA